MKKNKFIVTAFYVCRDYRRYGRWELKYLTTREEALAKIQKEDGTNWPSNTIWKTRVG